MNIYLEIRTRDLMRIKLAAISAAIGLSLIAVACGSSENPTASPTNEPPVTQTPGQPTPTAELQNFNVAFSSKERVEAPEVPSGDLDQLATGNNRFALDLYGELAGSEDGNLFMSPYSISLALAMTYAGADGETAQQMADTLGFTLPPEKLHAAFNALDQLLESRGAELEPDEKFTLQVANSIWGQDGFEFRQPFLDTLAENYGAGMRLVDYDNAAEQARLAINRWVEENTNDRIKDLIPQGALSEDTILVLANAIFFKAAWANEFDPSATEDAEFNLLDGESVTVQMMRQHRRYVTGEGDGYRAISIPYVGFETSMVVIVPDEGKFESIEQSLDSEKLQTIIEDMSLKNLELQFPKFTFKSKFSLPLHLRALGMEDAFSWPPADFTGMTDVRPDLFIADVIHQSFVAVDEQGTEAAAATAVLMEATSASPPTEPLIVDRPFIFLIRDVRTDTVLFMGRLLDPSV